MNLARVEEKLDFLISQVIELDVTEKYNEGRYVSVQNSLIRLNSAWIEYLNRKHTHLTKV